jgi:hypothetical protein
MSYSIYIGEAILQEYDPKDYDGEFAARYSVEGAEEEEAPEFENDTMTGKGNSRHPGYGAWDDFARSAGLHSFFFDKESGVMRKHPGCFALTKEHQKTVADALTAYQAKYPNTKPGFTSQFMPKPNSGIIGSDSRSMGAPDEVVAEYHLARLIWLDWWIQWALKNCKRPAISNS